MSDEPAHRAAGGAPSSEPAGDSGGSSHSRWGASGARGVALAALLAGYTCTLLYAPVRAQEPRRLTRDEAALAITLARVAYNEAGPSRPDLGLIWQVTRGRASTPATRLAFLRRHSSCAAGVLPQAVAERRPGSCRWARWLDVRGHEPRGWDEARDGEWRRVRARWLAHLARALEHVRLGDAAPAPCAEAPWTWDGRAYEADWTRRGLVEVECEGTRNAGLVPARGRT